MFSQWENKPIMLFRIEARLQKPAVEAGWN